MQDLQWGKRAVEKSRWMRGNDYRMEGGGKQIEAWGWVLVEKLETEFSPSWKRLG